MRKSTAVLFAVLFSLLSFQYSNKLGQAETIIEINFQARLLEWHPLEDLIAVSGRSGGIHLFDTNSLEELSFFGSDSGLKVDLEWSPDGKYLASLNRNYLVQVWDANTGNEIQSIRIDASVSRDNLYLMTKALSFSPDGGQIGVLNDEYLTVWDYLQNTLVDRFLGLGTYESVDWCTDYIIIANVQGGILLLDSNTQYPIDEFESVYYPPYLPEHSAQFVACSPNEARFAYIYWDQVDVREIERGEILATLEHDTRVNSIAWSPDGQWLATATGERKSSNNAEGYISGVQIWDAENYRLSYEFNAHTNAVLSISWSPDGSQLASSSLDGTIRIWEIPSND